jgi:CRISPR-associated protein Cmr2
MTTLWKKKLAAWLHDPAEKALVLMRDVDAQGRRIGHEEGSVAALRAQLGIAKSDFDGRADRLAAGADRPSWPQEKDGFRPLWSQVNFVDKPVLIHPLSGAEIHLGKLDDIQAAHVRSASFAHFNELIERLEDGSPDYRLTQLAFWRFGPEPALVAPDIGELWRLLPADTRVPDHSIWSHLDVVSALTGALSGADVEEKGKDGGDEPALLTMSFGPVQGFIAQARSTSDLWAGSHLLSSLVWEGLQKVCEAVGPDAVLFPSLRGVAAVDRWLLELARQAGAGGRWEKRFRQVEAPWLQPATDANPLFAATLPNKFMALVPQRLAQGLAEEVTRAVRTKAQLWATQAATKVFSEAGFVGEGFGTHWQTQIAEQLDGFPEVHWSIAPWSQGLDERQFPATEALEQSLAAFRPDAGQGFFAQPLWQLLSSAESVERRGRKRAFRKLLIDGQHEFFVPNHGLLYPAVHELAERGLAAAKSLRTFKALPQQGFRCTLTGEQEWLTGDVAQATDVWSAVAGRFGIKAGERLCALSTLKRLWPTLFVEQVREFLEGAIDGSVSRYVVSTYTMALATSLEPLAQKLAVPADRAQLEKWMSRDDRAPVLPRSVYLTLKREPGGELAARVPAALDRLREPVQDPRAQREAESQLRGLESEIGDLLGHKSETYYALIQMDGDRMGAWMAGNEPAYQRAFADTWHPQVRAAAQQKFGHVPDLKAYMASLRPTSPARHMAISKVLNDFSTHVARHVIEEVFKGKLIYAGGDDVLAMVSVDDLMPAMLLLRAAYSGVGSIDDLGNLQADFNPKGLMLGRGFVKLGRQGLMLMMGEAATASIGAVVAHHQAPLSAVVRQLRQAEHDAKAHRQGGRNAFCLRVIKRGGGEVGVTSQFWTPAGPLPALDRTALGLLMSFARLLAQPGVSRRAVYRTTEWLRGLPLRPQGNDAGWRAMVAANLAFQLHRQGVNWPGEASAFAADFVALACSESVSPGATADTLENLLVTAEFFAREGRFGADH